jgi:hypothetical protein
MALDLTYMASLSEAQREVFVTLINDIESEEPFGPGVTSDWVDEMREKLRLSAPRQEDIDKCETLKKIAPSDLTYSINRLADSQGLPVISIIGNSLELDKIFCSEKEN